MGEVTHPRLFDVRPTHRHMQENSAHLPNACASRKSAAGRSACTRTACAALATRRGMTSSHLGLSRMASRGRRGGWRRRWPRRDRRVPLADTANGPAANRRAGLALPGNGRSKADTPRSIGPPSRFLRRSALRGWWKPFASGCAASSPARLDPRRQRRPMWRAQVPPRVREH